MKLTCPGRPGHGHEAHMPWMARALTSRLRRLKAQPWPPFPFRRTGRSRVSGRRREGAEKGGQARESEEEGERERMAARKEGEEGGRADLPAPPLPVQLARGRPVRCEARRAKRYAGGRFPHLRIGQFGFTLDARPARNCYSFPRSHSMRTPNFEIQARIPDSSIPCPIPCIQT